MIKRGAVLDLGNAQREGMKTSRKVLIFLMTVTVLGSLIYLYRMTSISTCYGCDTYKNLKILKEDAIMFFGFIVNFLKEDLINSTGTVNSNLEPSEAEVIVIEE